MTRILLDMCVDRRVGPLVADSGHDVVHVADLGMARSPDHEVMDRALAEGRVVVTHDSDFAQLLARSGADAPSVVQIRAPAARHGEVAAMLVDVLRVAAEALEEGAVVSLSPRGARIRDLPMKR